MKLLIGLGNPGKDYERTRHNIGFMLLDRFLKDYELTETTEWDKNEKLKSDIAVLSWERKHGGSEKIILAKPNTYMNNSGQAISLLQQFYKVEFADIWIFHDDVDFPVGSLRIRFGGVSAGHRGVMSTIEKLGTDKFWRFRLGIGRSGESGHSEISHYVLDQFSHQDHAKIREMLKHGSKAIQIGLENGLEAAMNQYNSK